MEAFGDFSQKQQGPEVMSGRDHRPHLGKWWRTAYFVFFCFFFFLSAHLMYIHPNQAHLRHLLLVQFPVATPCHVMLYPKLLPCEFRVLVEVVAPSFRALSFCLKEGG